MIERGGSCWREEEGNGRTVGKRLWLKVKLKMVEERLWLRAGWSLRRDGGDERRWENGGGCSCAQGAGGCSPGREKDNLGFLGFYDVYLFLVPLLVADNPLFIEFFSKVKFKISPQLVRLFQFCP